MSALCLPTTATGSQHASTAMGLTYVAVNLDILATVSTARVSLKLVLIVRLYSEWDVYVKKSLRVRVTVGYECVQGLTLPISESYPLSSQSI